ncbi:hypothetical protein LINGRAHAP2_LOCUS2024, partial [Linum grandiflorum]
RTFLLSSGQKPKFQKTLIPLLSEFRRTELRSNPRLKDQTTFDRRETRREA